MSKIKVSVIMPCYNHAKFITVAIESILNQTYKNFELIITDDCSKDDSSKIIRKFEKLDKRVIGIYHSENGGEGRSRNDAISKSTGQYIALCDSDDLWERDKLEKQVSALTNRAYDVVHSDSIIIDERGATTGKRFSETYQKRLKLTGNLFKGLCFSNFINVPTAIFRRNCINDAGLFEESFKYLTDWVFWVRVSRRHLFYYIDEPLARYRVHGGSTAHNKSGFAQHRIRAYRLFMDELDELDNRSISRLCYMIGVNYLELREPKMAKDYYMKALSARKSNISAWILLCFPWAYAMKKQIVG